MTAARELESGIGALRLLGYRFRYVESGTFGEVILLGSFAWPDHYDRVLISDDGTAFAIRNEHGRSATWLCQGESAEVVWAMVDLAPPVRTRPRPGP